MVCILTYILSILNCAHYQFKGESEEGTAVREGDLIVKHQSSEICSKLRKNKFLTPYIRKFSKSVMW